VVNARSAIQNPKSVVCPEDPTSEANSDENVVIAQNEAPVAVAANSGVDSGLDKREQQPCRADRGASAELLASPPGAAYIFGLTDDVVQGSPEAL
jgi:hypothetical protein